MEADRAHVVYFCGGALRTRRQRSCPRAAACQTSSCPQAGPVINAHPNDIAAPH
ncbi:hypothetical protein EMGBS3_15180 [Anaerolineaceae bacterium]|nr:hypothetical protein EMGBS3_15180 [Anaerolineaceae bacterium]